MLSGGHDLADERQRDATVTANGGGGGEVFLLVDFDAEPVGDANDVLAGGRSPLGFRHFVVPDERPAAGARGDARAQYSHYGDDDQGARRKAFRRRRGNGNTLQ